MRFLNPDDEQAVNIDALYADSTTLSRNTLEKHFRVKRFGFNYRLTAKRPKTTILMFDYVKETVAIVARNTGREIVNIMLPTTATHYGHSVAVHCIDNIG